jgi:Lrp/AsnC family leucine-responsive transcriptional regulator
MTADSEALDKIDREILRILDHDARISWQALGDRVHLSANAAAERVRRLRRRGVIRRFTVDIDQEALGRTLMAVVDVRIDHRQGIEDRLRERDDVLWAARVTGIPDIKVAVACAGTAGLDEFIAWLEGEGARETTTDVVLNLIR